MRVADAEHHRRGRDQSDLMNGAHHVEPFLSGAFCRDAFADLVVEDLAAAAGQRIQSGVFQPAHYRLVIEPADQMNVVYLGRRKTVKLKFRIFCVQRAQQLLVPLDIKIRMQAALHQHAGAAESDRLVDPFADLVDRMHVRVGLARPAIKRAERADDVADVRVIDVAVDDVGDDVGGFFRWRISSAARPMRTKSFDSSSAVQSSDVRRSPARALSSMGWMLSCIYLCLPSHLCGMISSLTQSRR